MPDPTLTLTIGGTAIDLDAADLVVTECVVFQRSGTPSLSFARRGGALPPTPDPYLGQAVTLALDDGSGSGPVVYFSGWVASRHPEFQERIGWVTAYQALSLRDAGDRLPMTDDNTGLDTAPFNQDPTNTLQYLPARAGRSVGQILSAVLTMRTNAANLNAYGIGGYTGLPSTPALPADTVADLAAMTTIPQTPVYIGGERFLSSLEAFTEQHAPNHLFWIDPATGHLRWTDLRLCGLQAFTLDSDPIEPTPLSRDLGGCYQRVLYRGQPWIEPWLLSLQNGQLAENFSSAQKSAFTAAGWSAQQAQDAGTCSCTDTTHVVLNTTKTYALDDWDQTATGMHGQLNLVSSTATGLQIQASRRVIASTATASGSFTVTLDLPLPATSYNSYTLLGTRVNQSPAYLSYVATNAAVGAALQTAFPYQVPFVSATGAAASLTSVPVGSVVYGASAPYTEFPLPLASQDPSTGTFTFVRPTYMVGNRDPHDVRILAAVATGLNQAVAPADVAGVPQYAGTSHTVDGLATTLVVTVPAWKDPGSLAAMQAAAADLLDSLKDAVIEGAITYYGFRAAALTPGLAVTVTGATFTTGWESPTSFTSHPGLPIVECVLHFDMLTGPVNITTVMRCSNRRKPNELSQFLRPERIGLAFGAEDVLDVAGAAAYLGVGNAWQGALASGLTFGADTLSAMGQAAQSIPTDPGSYLQSVGAPTSVADMGLPQTPADLGLPTSPGKYLEDQGLPNTQIGFGDTDEDQGNG